MEAGFNDEFADDCVEEFLDCLFGKGLNYGEFEGVQLGVVVELGVGLEGEGELAEVVPDFCIFECVEVRLPFEGEVLLDGDGEGEVVDLVLLQGGLFEDEVAGLLLLLLVEVALEGELVAGHVAPALVEVGQVPLFLHPQHPTINQILSRTTL
jgi:hypothetical protein